ncbi:MAG TPA: hypothetical protein VFO38_05595, partial [Candidatus Saccharimonadales bacterium]|nr:hypothetical protein [Candidatus Saccharimonadales bacterium]
ISVLFYAVMLLAVVTLIVRFPQPEAFFASMFGVAFSWVIFATSTHKLKYRRVFRLPKSQAHFEMLDTLRSRCRHYLSSPNSKVVGTHLPYELLWQRFGVLTSVKSGYYTKPPRWFDGNAWPTDPEELSAVLRDSLAMMAGSLEQPLVGKAEYAPDEETQAALGETIEKLGDGLGETIEAADDMRELIGDLGEWGGGDSASGDGGDGSGGDGGGDGGGGDG